MDFYDWNGDGRLTDTLVGQPQVRYLQGDECLIFFLGGIPAGEVEPGTGPWSRQNSGPPGGHGFGKKPAWPTERPIAGAGRDGPFFELPSERLIDRDNDAFYELVMFRFRKPDQPAYVYFSAYDGLGYRPDDLNLTTEPKPNESATNRKDFAVLWTVPNSYPTPYRQGTGPPTEPYYIRSPGPNPYTIGPSYVSPSINPAWVVRYHRADSFQIISPGLGAGYGDGGELPLTSNANEEDQDNLTSFSGAELKEGKL
jgi:hypothetical protein